MTLTQDTFININRNSEGQIVYAELLSGFACLETEAVLLDIYDPNGSGANSEYSYGSVEHRFMHDGEEIVIPANEVPEVLIASWVTNPPAEPTKHVRLQGLWDQHVDMEVARLRGK